MSSLVVMELSCPVPYTWFLDVSMSSDSAFPEPEMQRLFVSWIQDVYSAGLPCLLFLLMQQATTDSNAITVAMRNPIPIPTFNPSIPAWWCGA